MRISDELKPWRCTRCGRILARMELYNGTVEIKCGSCNTVHLREAADTSLGTIRMVATSEGTR